MQGKKLFTILDTFDETEWRACNKFLKFSSKKGSRVITIFNYIYKNRETLNAENFDLDGLRKKTCKDVSLKSFLNRLSDLSADIDSFLVFREMQSPAKAHVFRNALIQVYKRKGLYSMFVKSASVLIKELEDNDRLSLFRSYQLLELYHSLYFSDLYGKKRKDLNVLDNAMKYCDQFSENLISYYNTEKFNAQRLRPISVSVKGSRRDQLKEMLTHYDQLTKNRNQTSYTYLESLLLTTHKDISGELAQTILISLINHCIYLTKLGNLEVVEELAKLNLFGLENGLLLEYNRISETRFLNIIDAISKSKLQIDADAFIQKWSPYVQTIDSVSLRNMAYAMWYFAKGEYDNTLEYLNYFSVNMTSLNYSLRARWMQICSLCSLYPHHEAQDESLNAAVSYFRRHRDSLDLPTYEGSLSLIRIVRLLWEKADINEVESAVKESKYLIFKYWIGKQIELRKRLE